MKMNRGYVFLLFGIVLALSACQPAAPIQNLPAPTVTQNSSGLHTCDYLPGKSQPAQISSGSPQPAVNPSPIPMTFNQTPEDAATIDNQMMIFNQIVKDIQLHYFSPDYNGVDWNSIQAKYKLLIQKGLSKIDFVQAMQQMVGELGDAESYYVSPAGQPTPTPAPVSDFVGIGASFNTYSENGLDTYVLTWVYSGSPAEAAGLKKHDIILKVDGGSFLDENGVPRTLGQAGSPVTITAQTPGQAPRDVKAIRRRISNPSVVDYCKVAGTAIGYIRWFDINDSETVDQTVAALKKMSAGSPLQGLIIDLRQSYESSSKNLNNLQTLMGLFTSGNLGSFIAPRGDSTPLAYTASMSDISGLQDLPLIVIQDSNTDSAPLIAGVLQVNGRARIVGQVANGEAYIISAMII